jgi:PAS domain S-box-containing protein
MSAPDTVNILLVDDNPAKLLSYEVILEELGENLLKASSAPEALDHLLRNEVAVILVDVCMPELDGFELAAMIREHPRCEDAAIIFISAVHLTDVDRLRGYAMGAVDYVPVPVIAEVLRAKVKVFTELYRKTRQLEQLNQKLESRVAERTAELESYAGRLLQSEKRRSLALAAGKMGSWDWDLLRGDCVWDKGLCDIFGVEPDGFVVTPERLRALVHPDDWKRLTQAWFEGIEGSRSYETEFRVRRPNGEIRWCFGTAAATVDDQERIVRVSGVATDVTERKAAEERQTILAREVDHRARNVLAIVQSIMRLTKAPTSQDYVEAVEGRIRSLSRAHMLLSESRWEGADLRRLANEELAPYLSDGRIAIQETNLDIVLLPRAAQTVAMVLHELATNAAKYGSLSPKFAGRIRLGWHVAEDALVIPWIESGVPGISPPDKHGYGMKLIEASLAQIGGHAAFDWSADGLKCTLQIPSDESVSQRQSAKGPERRPRVVSNILGNRVLVVEDEALVAMMLTDTLAELGFEVVGPFRKVADAMAAVDKRELHAALLDVNLAGERVYPLANLLQERGIPFAFVTGYGVESIEKPYRHCAVLQKPIDRTALESVFFIKPTVEARAERFKAAAESAAYGKKPSPEAFVSGK